MDKAKKARIKKALKDTWYFIWESDSVWSWIVNIILAFIIIKFIVYPVIGAILTTSYPIVAVVSGSMEHDGSFEDWWSSSALCDGEDCSQSKFYERLNISKEDFLEFRYKNGFNKGDIMLLKGTEPNHINVGDVIVFRSIRPDPIIHRVVGKENMGETYYFQTKGDHNPYSYPSLGEDSIHEDKVIGKAILRIPSLGYIKIIFVNIIAEPYCRMTGNLFPC